MKQWHKTGCVLCPQNCGLEIAVEEGRMTAVRPDKDNLKSKGYACRKGLNVIGHQYPKDRLTHPLKKENGRFKKISWEDALDEISEKLKQTLNTYGPRSIAYMGGSAPGGQLEAGFGLTMLRALGSQYYYSSAGQEFSGHWWVTGRVFGKQYNISEADEKRCEMLVAWGWNGMESHQIPRAPVVLKKISKDPDRLLVVIDPRKSETAQIADIHLPIRPGCDALLLKSMISILLRENLQKTAYLADHVASWEKVAPWFDRFDIDAALKVCGLSRSSVDHLCRLMSEKKWGIHQDLGIYMGRHSTMNSYLIAILGAVCGIFQTPGGNMIPGMLMPMGFHADERDPKTWKTLATGLGPVAAGSFPPAVLPEEVLSDHPERLRALYLSACNPLRAYPDTTAYEKAFDRLDLVVVNDIAMTETARLADYVLPCRTFYESWDTSFFPMTYPKVHAQLRRPIVDPPEHCLEASQIHTRLADRLGLIPEIPAGLYQAAQEDRLSFGMALMEWAGATPGAIKMMPFVLAKTLGEKWDSAAKAGLWGMLMTAPRAFRENAVRAGFKDDPLLGDTIFQNLIDTPQGVWIGMADTKNPMSLVKTGSGKLEIYIPELAQSVRELDAAGEEKALAMPLEYPMILNAGRHSKYNMNTMMRDPGWNRGKRFCTVSVNPEDAREMGLADKQQVRVTTTAGSETGELQTSERVRKGTALIPHGFGLEYDGKKLGINVNRLTSAQHRDPIGTPIHRFVPCRIEPAG